MRYERNLRSCLVHNWLRQPSAAIDEFEAHTPMSKQAPDSQKVRGGLKDLLLGPAQLYERCGRGLVSKWSKPSSRDSVGQRSKRRGTSQPIRPAASPEHRSA